MSTIEGAQFINPERHPINQEGGSFVSQAEDANSLPELNNGTLELDQSAEDARLFTMVNLVMDTYASRAMPILRDKVRKGEDKGEIKLGEGKTYKLGDVEITIDPLGENILHELVEPMGLPAVIHGEHQRFDSPTGEEKIHFAIDPFDNTSEYQAGLDTPPWTVVSAYTAEGNPISTFIGNIKDNKGFFLQNGKIYEKDFETGERREVKKSQRKSLLEDGSVLASYLGSKEYSSKFMAEFKDFIDNRSDRALLYGGGGAYIYGPLAAGRVGAYVMFEEPYEEIDPGAGIAMVAGCTIGHYNLERDEWTDYKYDPNREEETIDGLFIAAATPEIRDELVEYYRNRNIDKAGSGVRN